ncbi:GPO family capsid scaffolding protein [Paraburkholderia bonniea]|uniref:GPO family capsid scaffolding protein n=1 Tax=Paraburkholderia bonniea TaxID=2152891 RepID=UPI0012929B8A
MATKSKFFRVAVEGDTTDGRVIQREWIRQMAASYDPATYGARVNIEHIRGYAPLSDKNPFGAYGDVIELEAREIEDGPLKGKMALFAKIDPTPQLIELTKARQKIYTSIEIDPSFSDSGSAYLVGLAATDNPASLGTEILSFAAQNPSASPFTAKKQRPENLFTAACEVVIEFEADGDNAGLFSMVKNLLTGASRKNAVDDSRFSDVAKAVEALATHSSSEARTLEKLDLRVAGQESELVELKKKTDDCKEAFEALKQTLSRTDGSTTH